MKDYFKIYIYQHICDRHYCKSGYIGKSVRPMFATFDKAEFFRKEYWNDMMGGFRIRMILHYMNNVSIEQPRGTELNRASFSQHYSGKCGKVGIFTYYGWEETIYILLLEVLETVNIVGTSD